MLNSLKYLDDLPTEDESTLNVEPTPATEEFGINEDAENLTDILNLEDDIRPGVGEEANLDVSNEEFTTEEVIANNKTLEKGKRLCTMSPMMARNELGIQAFVNNNSALVYLNGSTKTVEYLLHLLMLGDEQDVIHINISGDYFCDPSTFAALHSAICGTKAQVHTSISDSQCTEQLLVWLTGDKKHIARGAYSVMPFKTGSRGETDHLKEFTEFSDSYADIIYSLVQDAGLVTASEIGMLRSEKKMITLTATEIKKRLGIVDDNLTTR